MNNEQKKSANDAARARERAAELERKAASASKPGIRDSFLKQAADARDHARLCDELANDRGY